MNILCALVNTTTNGLKTRRFHVAMFAIEVKVLGLRGLDNSPTVAWMTRCRHRRPCNSPSGAAEHDGPRGVGRQRSLTMKRPSDIDETASRANDMKSPEEREAEARGRPAPKRKTAPSGRERPTPSPR